MTFRRIAAVMSACCVLGALSAGTASSQTFSINSILGMAARPVGPAGPCGVLMSLSVTHLAFDVPTAFPIGLVDLLIVQPGTTTVVGGAGAFGVGFYPAGTSTFTFVPPPGGPFEIRIHAVGIAPPWIFYAGAFTTILGGGTAAACPYSVPTPASTSNAVSIGGSGAAGGAVVVTCAGAPASAPGLLAVSPNSALILLSSGNLLVDLLAPGAFLMPWSSNSVGVAQANSTAPLSLAGVHVFLQGAFADALSPGGAALSFGLQLTL